MIQMDEANKLERMWTGGKCNIAGKKNYISALKQVIIVAHFVVQLVPKWI